MASQELEIVVTAKDKASKVLSGIDGTLRELSGIGTKVMIGAAGAAVALGGAAVVAGKGLLDVAKSAFPLEGVQAAFEGITGASSDMLDKLRQGSLGTVLDVDLMKNYNLAAQLVSKTFADQLPDAMGYLTKVSASTGQSMDYLMDSLVRGVGRLSPRILDNMGVTLNLNDTYEKYAATLGKNTDELTQAEKQAAVMNETMRLLAENTASMPDLAGTAAVQWKALGIQFQNMKQRLGLGLLPALKTMMGALGELAERMMPKIEAFAAKPPGILETNVIPLVEKLADWAMRMMEVPIEQTFIGQVWAFLQQNGPAIVGAIEGILVLLAGAKIYTIISGIVSAVQVAGPIIVGIVGAISWPVLAVVAAVALLGAAWATNFLGIRDTLTAFWENTAKPILTALGQWLGNNIRTSITWLADAWNNVLLPALRAVWDFISTYIIPLFTAIVDVHIALFKLAITALAGLWQNVLWPAIQKVWDILKNTLGPAVEWLTNTVFPALGNFVEKTLGPVLSRLREKVLEPLAKAWDAIKTAIGWVIDKLQKFKDMIANIQLPDWLTPGSPTPFELGLLGIAGAMDELNKKQLPEFRANIAAANGGQTVNNAYNLTINTSAPVEPIIADFNMMRAFA